MTAVRVGFDTGPLFGPRTGIGLAVHELHDALSARDDVALVDYVVSLRARFGGVAPKGTRFLPLPAAVAHRLWAVGNRPVLDRWLGDVEVVHGTNYVVPPSRLPRLVSVYDCWFLRHPEQAGPAVQRAGEVLRKAIAGGAHVHTSSHATAEAVRALFPSAAVHTVPLAALPLSAPPDSVDAPIVTQLGGRPFVVAIGTIERRKNLALLVRAFGSLAGQFPDLCLVLAGAPGDDAPAVERAIESLGGQLSARVVMPGRVDDDTRSWLLHHASVLAYPSLDEGFGFPLLDAMQAGVPVVASDAGSIPEVAGEAALLSPSGDADALATNLQLALQSRSVREHLVATGRQRVEQFSWQRTAAELAGVYRRVKDAAA